MSASQSGGETTGLQQQNAALRGIRPGAVPTHLAGTTIPSRGLCRIVTDLGDGAYTIALINPDGSEGGELFALAQGSEGLVAGLLPDRFAMFDCPVGQKVPVIDAIGGVGGSGDASGVIAIVTVGYNELP